MTFPLLQWSRNQVALFEDGMVSPLMTHMLMDHQQAVVRVCLKGWVMLSCFPSMHEMGFLLLQVDPECKPAAEFLLQSVSQCCVEVPNMPTWYMSSKPLLECPLIPTLDMLNVICVACAPRRLRSMRSWVGGGWTYRDMTPVNVLCVIVAMHAQKLFPTSDASDIFHFGYANYTSRRTKKSACRTLASPSIQPPISFKGNTAPTCLRQGNEALTSSPSCHFPPPPLPLPELQPLWKEETPGYDLGSNESEAALSPFLHWNGPVIGGMMSWDTECMEEGASL